MNRALNRRQASDLSRIPADHWKDVCLKNAEIWRVACRAMSVDPRPLDERIAQITGRSNLTRREMRADWRTLAEYQALEDCVVDKVFGHPDLLRVAAHYAVWANYGGIDAVERWLLRGPLKEVCSARIVYRAFPGGTATFNRNKMFRHIVEENHGRQGRVVMEMYYLTGPGGIKRSANIEHRSVLYHILGLFEGAGTLLRVHDYSKPCEVKWLTVDISPQVVLDRECAGAVLSKPDSSGLLYLHRPGGPDVKAVAELAHLEPDLDRDPEHQRLLDVETVRAERTMRSITAVRFLEDVTTHGADGEPRPVLRAGTCYRLQQALPNIVEARYTTSPVTRFFDRIVLATRPMERGLKLDKRVSEAEAAAAAQLQVLRTLVPTELLAHQMRDGTLAPFSTQCGVLAFDLEGSRARARREGWDAQGIATHQGGMVNALFDLALRRGGYVFKGGGDGGIIVFSAEWPRFEQEPVPFQSGQEAATAMLNVIPDLCRTAAAHGWRLRVGGAWGEVQWFDASKQQLPGRSGSNFAHLRKRYLEGGGDPLGEAARAEASLHAWPQVVMVTDALLSAACGAPIDPTARYDSVFGYMRLGEISTKPGEAPIDAWISGPFEAPRRAAPPATTRRPHISAVPERPTSRV